jgi:hypothetical protein
MHPTDDLTTRGALMVARAAARVITDPAEILAASHEIAARRIDGWHKGISFTCVNAIRAVSTSDAALARAIDAVPGAN